MTLLRPTRHTAGDGERRKERDTPSATGHHGQERRKGPSTRRSVVREVGDAMNRMTQMEQLLRSFIYAARGAPSPAIQEARAAAIDFLRRNQPRRRGARSARSTA